MGLRKDIYVEGSPKRIRGVEQQRQAVSFYFRRSKNKLMTPISSRFGCYDDFLKFHLRCHPSPCDKKKKNDVSRDRVINFQQARNKSESIHAAWQPHKEDFSLSGRSQNCWKAFKKL
jgi:hypothetical protein